MNNLYKTNCPITLKTALIYFYENDIIELVGEHEIHNKENKLIDYLFKFGHTEIKIEEYVAIIMDNDNGNTKMRYLTNVDPDFRYIEIPDNLDIEQFELWWRLQ